MISEDFPAVLGVKALKFFTSLITGDKIKNLLLKLKGFD